MTILLFVLTALVMVRQGVLLRDDALLRERRAAGLVEEGLAGGVGQTISSFNGSHRTLASRR